MAELEKSCGHQNYHITVTLGFLVILLGVAGGGEV